MGDGTKMCGRDVVGDNEIGCAGPSRRRRRLANR